MISTSIVQTILGVRLSLDKNNKYIIGPDKLACKAIYLLSSPLPESEEDIDPVKKNIWKLSTES